MAQVRREQTETADPPIEIPRSDRGLAAASVLTPRTVDPEGGSSFEVLRDAVPIAFGPGTAAADVLPMAPDRFRVYSDDERDVARWRRIETPESA